MSKLYVLYFVAYSVYILSYIVSAEKANCLEPKSPKINILADIQNKYKKLRICGHYTDTKAVIDSDGRWIVSYRANTIIHSEEEAEKLCQCMSRFILQSDWTEGAIHVCKNECTSLTMFLIGARNPDFIGLRKVTDTCYPIRALGAIVDKFPDVELVGQNCYSHTSETSSGEFRILSECDIDPEPEKVCAGIYEFFNTEGFLNGTKQRCFVENNRLYLEIVEQPIEGYCY